MSSYHNFSLFPMAITLVLVIVALLIIPLDAQNDFQVKLRRVDSGMNLTKLELLRRALKRDEKRLHSLYPMALAASRQSIESLIHYGGHGEFFMELSIGTPPKPYSAILDTGSDLIWTQCKPCKHCFHQPHPIFDPRKSSSFSKPPCSNNLCTALHPMSSCSRDNKSCEYLQPYADGTLTRGFIATETLGFGKVSVRKVGFGCGINNTGEGLDQADGLVGLGRGPLSLVSQLNVTMFSYCLPSLGSNEIGTLLMGSFACTDQGGSIEKTTPLIKNPTYPSFYYLSLEGITVGDTKLPINKSTFAIKPDGSGGMVIDSGTEYTYIEESAFNLTKKEFIKQVKHQVVDESRETGLDLCFKLTPKARNFIFPNLTFHFQGVDLALPKENYIYVDPSGVACLTMFGNRWVSIFGNFQLQNIQVVHDLKRETLTFLPRNCAQI